MAQSLSAWVMSIAGIVCLSVLVELILPNGQMNKYIKGIFSFIIILVIISPIPTLLGKKVNLDSMFDSSSQIEVQKDYLYQANLNKVSALQKDIESQISAYGYKNVKARLDCDIFSSQINFRSAYIDLSDLVISESAVHKDILSVKSDIVSIVTALVNLKKEKVVFNE